MKPPINSIKTNEYTCRESNYFFLFLFSVEVNSTIKEFAPIRSKFFSLKSRPPVKELPHPKKQVNIPVFTE